MSLLQPIRNTPQTKKHRKSGGLEVIKSCSLFLGWLLTFIMFKKIIGDSFQISQINMRSISSLDK